MFLILCDEHKDYREKDKRITGRHGVCSYHGYYEYSDKSLKETCYGCALENNKCQKCGKIFKQTSMTQYLTHRGFESYDPAPEKDYMKWDQYWRKHNWEVHFDTTSQADLLIRNQKNELVMLHGIYTLNNKEFGLRTVLEKFGIGMR